VVISDPDDDPILQTAIAGDADVLCTRDEAFRHELVEQVCHAHNIRIVSDVALMQELRRETNP
jgi:predicted nucleic acid-binding protein